MSDFGCPWGPLLGSRKCWKTLLKGIQKLLLIRSCLSGLLGAAGGHFGLDFGPQARYAIFVKKSTAPRREHDFEGSGGSQKGPKIGPKTASDGSPAQKPSWGPLGPHFGPFWGPLGEPKSSPKPLPKQGPKLSHFQASPGTPQAARLYPPGVVTQRLWGPGGRLQRGVLNKGFTILWTILQKT